MGQFIKIESDEVEIAKITYSRGGNFREKQGFDGKKPN